MMEALFVSPQHTTQCFTPTTMDSVGGSRHNQIFLHLNPFVLSLLLRHQQLLSFETFNLSFLPLSAIISLSHSEFNELGLWSFSRFCRVASEDKLF